MKAAIYLRVSTLDQVMKGNSNRDGFSIPAQKEACVRKAKELGASDIKEYIDRGESARSADRPALQELLHDLIKEKNFDYVIVHKLDRLARSVYDDVTIALTIKRSGAQLISVMENIDDSPSGSMLHGIIAVISEFYSRNLAIEAMKGSTEKAKQGGTPFQAPIGYLNIIERINQRENRTVIIDHERAPLITWAFERFATGDYSRMRLLEELNKRGLKTRLGKPISITNLVRILTNRYYLSYVSYCGVEYKGNHQPLVTPAIFSAVQTIIANQRSCRATNYRHHHFLSRLLLCERCQRHLCFTIARHKYPYFFCQNRSQGCQQPYIPLYHIESSIIDALKQVIFSKAEKAELVSEINKELKGELKETDIEIKRQTRRIDKSNLELKGLLEAYGDKVIEGELLKKEQTRINKEIKLAENVLSEAKKRSEIIKRRTSRALELAADLDIGQAFSEANPLIKLHFCRAYFSSVQVNDVPTIIPASPFPKRHWRIIEHHVSITVNWHNPINIRQITEALLSLCLERDKESNI
jgi:DNA invertase Pin-like site-specific DNA recombinase